MQIIIKQICKMSSDITLSSATIVSYGSESTKMRILRKRFGCEVLFFKLFFW